MTQGEVLDVLRDALMTAIKICAPVLIISIAVGLVIAIFQAATQIHEQTLTFVPKALTVAIFLLLAGSWMIHLMSDFIYRVVALMASI